MSLMISLLESSVCHLACCWPQLGIIIGASNASHYGINGLECSLQHHYFELGTRLVPTRITAMPTFHIGLPIFSPALGS
jgi:hypothetical protein